MTQPYRQEAQNHVLNSPQASLLDSLFSTQRILNIAICSSSVGILILLSLTYLLADTGAVLHIGILAALMMLLLIALIIYKIMLGGDVEIGYKRLGSQEESEELKQKDESEDNYQNKRGVIQDDSDDSSIVEILPTKNIKNQQQNSQNSKQM